MRSRLLLGVLFLTAFSSLVYELVWTRVLSHLFGVSALAEATVLAIFMGGLALGSLFGGRMIAGAGDRIRFLAVLELAIGLSCLLALGGFELAHANYLNLLDLVGDRTFAFSIGLFLVAGLLLILPTFLIGVTFPAIVQLVHDQRRRVGESVGSCYMVDTIGGSLGLIVAAFFLVPRVGFLTVSLIASAVNLGMGVLLFTVRGEATQAPSPAGQPAESPAELGPQRGGLLIPVLFFFSGFAALCFEVIWIRHVALIYGGSMHAFAIVVVSFLAGIGIGSLLYNLLFRGVRDHVGLFAGCVLGVGLSGVLVTMLLPRLEWLFLALYSGVDSYAGLMSLLATICFLVLLLPTILMGMTLPVLSALHASRERVGGDVGRLFAVNSFGALCGSFVAGFVLIPTLGIHAGALVPGVIYVVIGLVFVLAFQVPGRARTRGVAVVSAIALLGAVAAWALYLPGHLYNGVFYLGTVYDGYTYFESQKEAQRELKFLEHGPHGQIAVYGEPDGMMTITNNGKIDASSDSSGLAPRSLLAHIPLLVHDNAQRVLNIGLGGGWTVAAVLLHDVPAVDVVEINPSVVRANTGVLASSNDNALADPRSGVIVADGRNYLANTTQRYDVIISEPPEIWVSGVSSLFTREFYATARRALRDGGLLCQWIPRYEMTEADYRMTLATIRSSFPFVYEFDMLRLTGLDEFQEFLVLGADRELDIEEIVARQRFSVGIGDSPHREKLLKMLRRIDRTYSRDAPEIDSWIAGVERVNTDDLPLLEFHTLRNRFRKFKLGD